jgi:serpin B
MPKFGYESTFLLKDMLIAMGMPEAFDDRADFSGMTGARGLCIGDVYHKAFITVDEAGTEAAAATAVTVYITSIELPPMSVAIDRPFIYFIRDNETGAILFVGRVLNPAFFAGDSRVKKQPVNK